MKKTSERNVSSSSNYVSCNIFDRSWNIFSSLEEAILKRVIWKPHFSLLPFSFQTAAFYGFHPKTVRSPNGNHTFSKWKPYGFGTENVKWRQLEQKHKLSGRKKSIFASEFLFASLDIQDYWFASGTPTYLIRLLNHTQEDLNEMTGRYYLPEEFIDYKADTWQ